MTTKTEATYDRKAAAALVKLAKELAAKNVKWTEANNKLFGIESSFAKSFPSGESRQAFHEGPEYEKIRQLISVLELPHKSSDADGPSGKFLVRLPRSLHAALQIEAQAEGVSLNQLALSKLSLGLRESVAR